MRMPKINRDQMIWPNLTSEEVEIVNLVVKKDDSIRASKPKVTDNPITGKAVYVWRMVVFMVSPKGQHRCIPCTHTFDLPAYDENGEWSTKIAGEMAKGLDVLVDAIVDCVDKSQWHGIRNWGRALGYL